MKPQPLFASVGRRLTRYALAADGRITELDALDMPCNVQYGCLDAARSLVYLGCSNGGVGQRGDHHRLVLVEAGERMQVRGAAIALPHRPIHLAIDQAGRRLLVAYNLPAAVTVHDLDAAGNVGTTRGPFEGAETVGWFPHQILPIPGSGDLLLTCRGDDADGVRAENPGSLRVLRTDGAGLRLQQRIAPHGGLGFGPRNCAFHPAAPWLYAVLERQNRLAVFRRGEGGIDDVPCHSCGLLEHPERLHRPQLGGAIAIHPEGRFAFVVNRAHAMRPHAGRLVQAGGENSIVTFGLDAATGAPSLLQVTRLAGVHARCMVMAHGGRLLVVAVRQDSARLVAGGGLEECPAGFSVFEVGADGGLGWRGHHAVGVGEGQLFWAGVGEG